MSANSLDGLPPAYTEREAWLIDNRVAGIKTSYEMTSADTAQDYVTLTSTSGKSVRWKVEEFRAIARLTTGYISSTSSLVEPVDYGLRDRVATRREWEKANADDLATYKRLKAKFEGTSPTPPDGAKGERR